MKKLFLLIPALMLAFAVNAEPIGPNDPNVTVSNVIKDAVAAASNNAIIELSDGIYKEDGNFAINKNITIQAAEGAHPVIAQRYYIYFNNSAQVTFKGIKFDGGAYGDVGAYDYALRTYGSPINRDETLTLENCEFVNYPGYNIYIERADRGLDAITITNCYFHNNTKYAIFIGKKDGDTKQSCNTLTIENSTFANVSGGYDVIYYDAPADEHTTSLSVDHCTFYNHPKRAINWQQSTNLAVSNCIFAQPALSSYKSVECVGGTITNCLYYQSDGFSSAASRTNILKGNPLFVDAANNDFRLNNASPARRENGTVWGDPRWKTATPAIVIPARLNSVDAFVSDSVGVRIRANEAAPDSIDFKMLGGSYGFEDMEWAKWKVKVSKAGYYNFTAHVFRQSSGSQRFEIKVLNSDESVEKISKLDESISGGEGTISSGKIELSANEECVIKIRNTYNWAQSRVLYIDATYEGGAIIAVPDTLKAVEALKSERAFVNAAGELRFTDDSHAGYVRDQYGKWRLSVAKAGNYKFTVSANSDNAQAYELTLKNSAETVDIASTTMKGSSNTPLKFALDVEDLAIGNYVLNIRDTTNYSHGRIEYIAVSYEGGAVVNAPGEILATEAKLLKEDGGTLKMSHLENGDIKYDENEENETEYALWNLNATEAGEMVISVNSPSGGHTLRFELYEGNTLKSSAEEGNTTTWQHSYSLTEHLNIPAAGTYTLKLINKQQYSVCVLHSITIAPYVAPAGVIMTDTDTDIAAWEENFEGDACDVQLNRTILGGMYNTICLPFPVNSTMCKAIFGNDVELYTLGTATISGDILNLQFDEASDIYQGTPVLIKTSTDIVNPLFEGVTVRTKSADRTNGGAVTFRGTFVSKDFHNGDQVLLLVANNMLSYPLSDRTLKGFRAYFEVNNPQASAPIRGARIIAGQNVVTSIDLVEAQTEGVTKIIENGQLIIIRDGVRHNALGVQVE